MTSKLYPLVRDYPVLALIGMCKNAGKTTVLNTLIQDFLEEKKSLGVTSIGRDGETTDLVTGTDKPGIRIGEGTLFATADSLLANTDVTREIVETTGFFTPMGEVILARALSDGSVQLAGPSQVSQLKTLSKMFLQYSAEHVLIDGAVGRRTLSACELCDAAVLCTGASLSRDIDEVVRQTRHVWRLFQLPVAEETGWVKTVRDLSGNTLKLIGDKSVLLQMTQDLPQTIRTYAGNRTRAVCLGGALSDRMAQIVLAGKKAGEKLVFIVRDASRILLSEGCYDFLLAQGCCIRVGQKIVLAAVTVNPYSAYGYPFGGEDFLRRMAAAVKVPVLDVKEGKHAGLEF